MYGINGYSMQSICSNLKIDWTAWFRKQKDDIFKTESQHKHTNTNQTIAASLEIDTRGA